MVSNVQLMLSIFEELFNYSFVVKDTADKYILIESLSKVLLTEQSLCFHKNSVYLTIMIYGHTP